MFSSEHSQQSSSSELAGSADFAGLLRASAAVEMSRFGGRGARGRVQTKGSVDKDRSTRFGARKTQVQNSFTLLRK